MKRAELVRSEIENYEQLWDEVKEDERKTDGLGFPHQAYWLLQI